MIDHLSTYATDYNTTKTFYENSLPCLGYTLQGEYVAEWNTEFPAQRMCAFGPEGRSIFWVIEVKESSSPRHVAFAASDRAAVEKFYEAALGCGGKDNGRPGLRPQYHENYFGAFVTDPDGNNIEAVCHLPE